MTATVTLLTPPASPAETNARPAAACGPTWTVVASPSLGTIENYLYAVTGISATDAWAVGMYSSTGLQQTLIEHWDGTEWTNVPSPNASGHNVLYGVAALSTDDVWAVGTHRPDLGTFKTLAMHWNGVEWSIVKSPNAAGDSFLYAAAAAGNQVWAIGQSSDAEPFRTLAMRWTGSRWKIVPTPNPYVGSHYLLGAAAVPSGSPRAWAAGNAANAPLILEWNGREWTSATAPGTDQFDPGRTQPDARRAPESAPCRMTGA